MAKKILTIILLLLAILPTFWPLAQPGFFRSDDGDWMVIRLSAFHQALKDGQFPVRFLYNLNHGYGYPVTNFLYPLPFYLGEAIHLLGFGFIDSVKILFILSFVLGAVFMYFYAGFWAAVIYSYFPYRLFDVYQRGSLGEAVAFIFLPLIFYFLDRKKIVIASIFTACLITSHNVVAFLFFPVAAMYLFFNSKSIIHNSLFVILSLMLSAWFWLPAIYDLQFTNTASIAVSDYTKYFLWPF